MRERDSLQRNQDILLLAQRIAELPRVQEKALAMYYVENMPLADIAACLGLSKTRTCQMLTRAVDLLQTYFLQTTLTPQEIGRNASPDQQARRMFLSSQSQEGRLTNLVLQGPFGEH